MKEPVNEKEVVIFFLQYYREMGFDKIINVHQLFPDCLALKDGKEVTIEFEYTTKGFQYHYLVNCNDQYGIPFGRSYKKFGDDWWECDHTGKKPFCGLHYHDKENKFTTNKEGILVYKTLVGICDFIVCWKHDYPIEEGIEVIELSKEIPKVRKT